MIYLDSAATSFYKPRQVGEGMIQALRTCASPGRGGHAPAMHAAEVVFSCRECAAKLFHASKPERVVFTSGATHSLNIAIHSLVRPGDRVVISGYEHNAVVRPLYALGAEVDVINTPLFAPDMFMEKFRKQLPGAAAAICTHVSNVFGYVLPLEDIASCCREYDVPLIVDAAQSAGVLNIDFDRLGAAFLAAPGHKGLMGPQGTGILLCKTGGEPLFYGGTGTQSLSPSMPEDLPERLEAGTHNVCGIAGLREGIRYILSESTENIRKKEAILLQQLVSKLGSLPQLDVISAANPTDQSSVVSVVHKSLDSEVFAEMLGAKGIAVRAGLHCAPLAHQTAGTDKTGTVRFSVSPFNTPKQIHQAVEVIKKI